jgi:MFS superfamily sulfate permease-like transporter
MVVLMSSRGRMALQWVLIIVVVAGLALDAYVHLHLAHAFKNVKTSTLSEADLFRAEAVVALIAAVLLLVRPRRTTAAFAFLVAAAGFVAVLVYRYVNVGKIGPIPNMYDPFWAPTEKTLSVFAEGIAALAALALVMMLGTRVAAGERAPLSESARR